MNADYSGTQTSGKALRLCAPLRSAKASVFSFLFSDPDTLRELYCALEGVSLRRSSHYTAHAAHLS